jgi:hypothetical protein
VIIRLQHLTLIFPRTSEPSAQLLQSITIPDLPAATSSSASSGGIELKYKNTSLAAPAFISGLHDGQEHQELNRGMVARMFGPTFDRNSPENNEDDMIYPGVGFSFDAISPGGNRAPTDTTDRDRLVRKVALFQSSRGTSSKGKDVDRERMKRSWNEVSDMEPTEMMDGTIKLCEIKVSFQMI